MKIKFEYHSLKSNKLDVIIISKYYDKKLRTLYKTYLLPIQNVYCI